MCRANQGAAWDDPKVVLAARKGSGNGCDERNCRVMATVTREIIGRQIEAKWRRGEITFAQFDWHLRSIEGV